MRRIQLADCHSDLDCDREVINKDVSCIWTCNFLSSCVHFIFLSFDTVQPVWILTMWISRLALYGMSLHQPTWYTPYPGLPLLQSKQRSQQDAENTICRGLQCCTDRTAAGIMISLQRIAAGIVQTQSVRQTKILIILLSRFEKNCGTNLKCIHEISQVN